jgi:hypothetical protein
VLRGRLFGEIRAQLASPRICLKHQLVRAVHQGSVEVSQGAETRRLGGTYLAPAVVSRRVACDGWHGCGSRSRQVRCCFRGAFRCWCLAEMLAYGVRCLHFRWVGANANSSAMCWEKRLLKGRKERINRELMGGGGVSCARQWSLPGAWRAAGTCNPDPKRSGWAWLGPDLRGLLYAGWRDSC